MKCSCRWATYSSTRSVEVGGDRDVVEGTEVLGQLVQAGAATVGADGHAEVGGHEQHAQDLVDATQPAGVGWQKWSASAWKNCLKVTWLATCSPVATRMGAMARAMAAWPRMSSGLVGSSIKSGSNSASSSM